MQPYELMAIVYDDLTHDIDYTAWFKALVEKINEIKPQTYRVLEVGAGTGNMTHHLINKGFHVTAIEPSEAMLSVLQEKMNNKLGKLNLFNGQLKAFKTKQKFDAVFAFLDVLNYMSPDDLPGFFSQAASLLNDQGLLVFDVSSPYKLTHVLGNNTFAENHDEFAYIWENHFDEDKMALGFDFVMFTENDEGTFDRDIESHLQYLHHLDAIMTASKDYFDILHVFGDDHMALTQESQRHHYYLVKKSQQEAPWDV